MDNKTKPSFYSFRVTQVVGNLVYYEITGPGDYATTTGFRNGTEEEVTAHFEKTIERLNFRMGRRAHSASWRGVQRRLKKKPKAIGFTKKSIKQQKAKARGKG